MLISHCPNPSCGEKRNLLVTKSLWNVQRKYVCCFKCKLQGPYAIGKVGAIHLWNGIRRYETDKLALERKKAVDRVMYLHWDLKENKTVVTLKKLEDLAEKIGEGF